MTGEETGPSKPKRSCWRLCFKVFLCLTVLTLLSLAAVVFVAFMVYERVTQPGRPREEVSVMIPPGVSGQEAGELLAEKGLVDHPVLFRLAMRLDKSGAPIKHGPYTMHKGLSPMELLRLLQEGPNRPPAPGEIPPEQKVTVPEGLTAAQIAQLFDNPNAFIEATADPALIARLGIQAPTLEGFLMPDTYFFDRKPTEREVVERMVEHFEEEYAQLLQEYPDIAQRDKTVLVTVASLVEEEARVEEERPAIAAVIYNRLARKMPLQLDSTLQYALGKYGERILYEDREVDSPYNTYLHAGLPPGPISCPGVASLRAAMRPAQTGYLYFVSNADGKTHTFSATEAEHLRAVERFRREIAPQRRAIEAPAASPP